MWTVVSGAVFTLPILLRLPAIAAPPAEPRSALQIWRLENGVVRADHGTEDPPLSVGSLQKPFVAKAWARAHPGSAPPRVRCDAASRCWRPGGHGTFGLARAAELSCNAYFRALAEQTPQDVLESTLRAEGFLVPRPLSADQAIGLEGEEGAVAIQPSRLLEAYVRLVSVPWPAGEAVRRELLAGLREGPLTGTARGLGRRGYWAKTGTVAALDGRPLRTSGWALAVDDAGRAVLGLLRDGTGREAAEALAPRLEARVGGVLARADETRPDRVRVALLDMLRPRDVRARNLGAAPVASSRGYMGPGATLALSAGDRLGEGLWELTLPGRGLVRRLRGALACDAGPGGTYRLRADVTRNEYVGGVLAAELPELDSDRAVRLGAAVLRFLAAGPHHGAVDVCDSTHCAWFVGRGPRVGWPTPQRPVLLASSWAPAIGEGPVLPGAVWARMLAAAREAGPALWTSHCGGAPLSAHAVWGNGDRRVWPCRRHSARDARPWSRVWDAEDLAALFGVPVTSLTVLEVEGVWTLHAETGNGRRDLRYDEAHRLLAGRLGWDALPSPASRVVAAPGGFRAEGVGFGHRVGLCLAD
jgi:hypothetical protein